VGCEGSRTFPFPIPLSPHTTGASSPSKLRFTLFFLAFLRFPLPACQVATNSVTLAWLEVFNATEYFLVVKRMGEIVEKKVILEPCALSAAF
jgi:hypothetical protein